MLMLFCFAKRRDELRVDVLEKSIDFLDDWLIAQKTDGELRFCLMSH